MEKLTKKYRDHIASAFDVDCNIFNVSLKEFENTSALFCTECSNQCDYTKTHLYGCYESVRWDNNYIYYCPCGYIFIAVPIFDEQAVFRNGVITGPILMGDPSDFPGAPPIPNLSTKKVNDIAQLISAVFAPTFGNTSAEKQTGEFLNSVYKELEHLSHEKSYPIELEKELQDSIANRDSVRSRELLNRLLGQIFFYSDGDLRIIKSRSIELVALLSRSAIEGGADIHQIFNLNNNCISEIESFDTLEKLSVWLTSIISRFVSYVFDFNNVKHSDVIYKITAYIKANYMKKISLADISRHVFLSKMYVSKIFKDEMKITLSEYINKTRIEKSKILLLESSLSIADVANLVGYEDQSYFTKNFKNLVGVSPGKYKEKHGKI